MVQVGLPTLLVIEEVRVHEAFLRESFTALSFADQLRPMDLGIFVAALMFSVSALLMAARCQNVSNAAKSDMSLNIVTRFRQFLFF